MQVSGLCIVPKSTGKLWVVHDLSSPKSTSVNDDISHGEFCRLYDTVDSAIFNYSITALNWILANVNHLPSVIYYMYLESWTTSSMPAHQVQYLPACISNRHLFCFVDQL